MPGAYGGAHAAVETGVLINHRVLLLDLDGIGRAAAHAQAAGNAAHVALGACADPGGRIIPLVPVGA